MTINERETAMHSRCSRIFAIGLGIAVAGICVPAVAQEETVPTARILDVDWPEVAKDVLALAPEINALPKDVAAKLAPAIDQEVNGFVVADKEKFRPLAVLDAMTAGIDPRIAKVPIPVLAPIDSSRYVSAFVGLGGFKPKSVSDFLSPAISGMQFLGKSTGYDVILSVKPSLLPAGTKAKASLAQIHLGGTGLLYRVSTGDASDGDAQRGEVVDDQVLQRMYPRLRRNVSDDGITYTFVKYGASYFVNISCINGPSYAADLPCEKVEEIVRTVLRDLNLIGGAPLPIPRAKGPSPRPTKKSPDFTYYAPGNLMPGTSQDRLGGVTSRTVWGQSDLLFPIKLHPAHANSQNFMHVGNCVKEEQQIMLDRGRYICRQNPDKVLQRREDTPENYAYPWRDNYCEQRDDASRQPKDCPARARAHEGQDIRPVACRYDGKRCKINLYDVVAVTNGRAWWKSNNNVKFVADDDTGVYYVYLHMDPATLRDAGLIQGQAVHVMRGDKIGKVGNWMHTDPHGTTAHLHFEIRSQTDMCGSYGCTSAPYWTLIRAYERLIGMQGREIP